LYESSETPFRRLERRVELETRAGTTVVYRDERKLDDLFAPLNLKVLGYLRSPYERRPVVVLGELRWGWEDMVGAELHSESKGAARPGAH
jgi:hypothetical protein